MKSKLLLFLGLTTLQASLFGCGLIGANNPADSGGSSGGTVTTETTDEAANITANWIDFETENGQLAVKFPGTPETESQSTPSELGELTFTMTSYADDANQQFFMVSSVTYPIAPDEYDAAQGLEAAKQGAVGSSGSTLVTDEVSDRFGMPGRKLVMNATQDNGEVYTTRAEIYIDPNGPTLHQILLVTEGDRVNTPEANAFFDSVDITQI
jgi:hypothetical protein